MKKITATLCTILALALTFTLESATLPVTSATANKVQVAKQATSRIVHVSVALRFLRVGVPVPATTVKNLTTGIDYPAILQPALPSDPRYPRPTSTLIDVVADIVVNDGDIIQAVVQPLGLGLLSSNTATIDSDPIHINYFLEINRPF